MMLSVCLVPDNVILDISIPSSSLYVIDRYPTGENLSLQNNVIFQNRDIFSPIGKKYYYITWDRAPFSYGMDIEEGTV